VNAAKQLFETRNKKTGEQRAKETPKARPAMQNSRSKKADFKGLAPGGFVKQGNHWTLARPNKANGTIVRGDAPKRPTFSDAAAAAAAAPAAVEAVEEPKRTSLRRSLGNTMKSLRNSFGSRKSAETDGPDASVLGAASDLQSMSIREEEDFSDDEQEQFAEESEGEFQVQYDSAADAEEFYESDEEEDMPSPEPLQQAAFTDSEPEDNFTDEEQDKASRPKSTANANGKKQAEWSSDEDDDDW